MQATESLRDQAARNHQIALIDARNYVVVGDPASRILVDN